MRNDFVDLANALAALKLKRGRFRGTREGTEIITPGKPTLLLTQAAARRFCEEREEAEND